MARKKTSAGAASHTDDSVLPAVNPVVEDHLPPEESPPFPIVAIGASAGGLAPRESHAGAPLSRRRARREPRRVLVVDDNVDSAESLRMLFSTVGHEVECVYTGEQAIEAALRMRPHAVMLDIGLPDTDGYSVARELRRHPQLRDTVIVATTGYSRPQDREKSRSAGIDDHMAKPVDVDALLDRIEQPR